MDTGDTDAVSVTPTYSGHTYMTHPFYYIYYYSVSRPSNKNDFMMDDEQATRRAPVALSKKRLATAEGIALLKVLDRKVFYLTRKIRVPL